MPGLFYFMKNKRFKGLSGFARCLSLMKSKTNATGMANRYADLSVLGTLLEIFPL